MPPTRLASAARGLRVSSLRIDAGKTFELGKSGRGDFRVRAKNVGNVPVAVYAVDRDGKRTLIIKVEPEKSADHTFKPNEHAIFVNNANQQARLDVKITGNTDLGVGYAANSTTRPK